MAASQQHDDYDDEDGYEPAEDDGGDGEGSRIMSLEQLSDAIARLEDKVSRALSGAGQPRRSSAQPASSGDHMTQADNAYARRNEIREELAALRAQERADAERGEIATRLGKVEKAIERAPRQLRRIEQRMGWHL